MPKKSDMMKIKVLSRPVILDGVTYRKGDELKCVKALAMGFIKNHYAEMASGESLPKPKLEVVREEAGE